MATYILPEHCEPTSRFLAQLSSAFHSCVPTPLAFLSTTLGVFSIISWLFAQMPQIYKNYQLQSASGLSIYFLAEWLLGDLTNLLGALLTGQATWQVIVASYYVTVDVILCYQYFWYTHLKSWRKNRLVVYTEDDNGGNSDSTDVLVGVSPSEESSGTESSGTGNGRETNKIKIVPPRKQIGQNITSLNLSSIEEKGPSSSSQGTARIKSSPFPFASPKTFLLGSVVCVALSNASPLHVSPPEPVPPISNSELAGRILSWTSTLLYLGSRLPQIYKNAIRQSTSGLSPTLFLAAFCGNFFYSTSLLTNPLAWSSYPPYGLHGWVGLEGSDRRTWVALAAPFWLGAAGVLVMDATIGVQFLVYRERMEKSMVLVKDKEGRSKWQEISGWMRGWVPGARRDGAVDEVVTRPLLDRQDRRSSNYGAA